MAVLLSRLNDATGLEQKQIDFLRSEKERTHFVLFKKKMPSIKSQTRGHHCQQSLIDKTCASFFSCHLVDLSSDFISSLGFGSFRFWRNIE